LSTHKLIVVSYWFLVKTYEPMRLLIAFSAFLLSVALYGQNNSSLSFDGVDDYVDCNEFLISGDEITFMSWIRLDYIPTTQANIFRQHWDGGHWIRFEGNGILTFNLNIDGDGDNSVSSDVEFNIDQWFHVAGTYNGNEIVLYINGVYNNSLNHTGLLTTYSGTGEELYLGAGNRVTFDLNIPIMEFINGNIDEASVWSTSLSQQEIQQYMNCPPTGTEEGLVGYWNFEEGSGATAFDQAENENDGIINGATWSTDTPGQNCVGCIDPVACNYIPYATDDDGSCDFSCCPGPGCCDVGTVWNIESQTCIVLYPSDSNFDGCVDLNDLMDLLSAYGVCAVAEFSCGDPLGYQGYDYSTVQIGEQCWFAENCRYLPVVSSSSAGSETSPYYYVYGYEGSTVSEAKATENYETYGVLYNWPAFMTEGICPSGWHIPSDGEWQTMEISLGMSESEASQTDWRGSPVGDYMKSTSGWNSGGNGSNSSGFNGLPGGASYSGNFINYGHYGIWWSASESGSSSWVRELKSDQVNVYRNYFNRIFGFSARCVRD
jgi:uncharacterized protein (TIGR02145 family)